MRLKHIFTLSALALGSIANPSYASDEQKEPVTVPAPPEGKAQVVFFRPGGMGGSAISCAVSEGGVKISSLPPTRFFILVTDPGKHVYSAQSEAKDEVYYDLKPGQTVYVKCSIGMGFLVGRPKLEAAQDLEFSTKTWKSVDVDRTSANVLTNEQIAAALVSQQTGNVQPTSAGKLTPAEENVAAPSSEAPAAAEPASDPVEVIPPVT